MSYFPCYKDIEIHVSKLNNKIGDFKTNYEFVLTLIICAFNDFVSRIVDLNCNTLCTSITIVNTNFIRKLSKWDYTPTQDDITYLFLCGLFMKNGTFLKEKGHSAEKYRAFLQLHNRNSWAGFLQ